MYSNVADDRNLIKIYYKNDRMYYVSAPSKSAAIKFMKSRGKFYNIISNSTKNYSGNYSFRKLR